VAATEAEVAAARRGRPAPPEVQGLLRALGAVGPQAPLTVAALQAWHSALTGGSGAWRGSDPAAPPGDRPPPAPARFVESRLRILEQWLASDSGADLKAAQQGALVMARVVEILPFEDGNGRVSRLAASHVMVKAGARPPVLVREDGPRLRDALQAAFALQTEPLCALLEEASARAMDAMIRALSPAPGP
jgi:Fic family protein